MGETSLRRKLESRLGALRSERSSWIEHWRDLADFLLPRRGRLLGGSGGQPNKGYKRNSRIINGVGTRALRTLRSGMAAGITPPTQPWFRLGPEDPDLAEHAPTKAWCERMQKLIYRSLAAGNFYEMVNGTYEGLGLAGTALLWQDEDFESITRFYDVPAGEFMLANDARGRATVIYREFQVTVEQLVGRFGLGNVTQAAKTLYDAGTLDAWVEVCHAVEPVSDRFLGRPEARGWAYVSVYWEKASDKDRGFLQVKGYAECPGHAPRWDLQLPDAYGRSPAMEALGDVKQLQLEERRKAQMIDKSAAPPLQGPPLLNQLLDTQPGAYNPTTSGQKIEPLFLPGTFRLADVTADIREIENRINTMMFADLFMVLLMDRRREKTAFETAEMKAESLLMLGPVLTQVNSELLRPVIERQFNTIIRASRPLWPDGGMIEPPPPELQNQQLKIDYVSSLQQAQRAVQVGGMSQLLNLAMTLEGVAPGTMDKIDTHQTVDELAELIGVPARMVRSDDAVAAIQQQKQAAAAAQQQAQAMALGADAAAKLGRAQMDGTALGELAGA